MSGPALLDLSRLETALGGDSELIRDILEMYETTAGDDLAALEHAVNAADLDGCMRRAHSLKGASANVGADAMAGVAAQFEKVARAGELERAVALVPDLRLVFSSTVEVCKAHRAA